MEIFVLVDALARRPHKTNGLGDLSWSKIVRGMLKNSCRSMLVDLKCCFSRGDSDRS